MSWVRVAVGSNASTEFTYLNLDHVVEARVVPTVSGPTGYTIEVYGEASADLGSIYARWDTAAHADQALQLLVGGVDLLGTTGQQA